MIARPPPSYKRTLPSGLPRQWGRICARTTSHPAAAAAGDAHKDDDENVEKDEDNDRDKGFRKPRLKVDQTGIEHLPDMHRTSSEHRLKNLR